MSDQPVYRSPFNPGLPEVAELPDIKAADTETLRLQGTLVKRMPSLPGGSLNDLAYTNYRAEAQAADAFATGQANEINKAYLRRSAAIAKAKNRQATKTVETSDREAAKTRKKQVRGSQRREKGVTKYFARNVLGVGPDLYR